MRDLAGIIYANLTPAQKAIADGRIAEAMAERLRIEDERRARVRLIREAQEAAARNPK